jgi:hypothetical protein
MSLWDDFSEAVGNAVNTAVDVVEDVVETVGDVVSDVVETAGNAAEDGLNAIGSAAPVISGLTGWLGNVVAGVTNFVSAIIKAVMGIVAGVIGGVIKIAAGILLLNSELILKGLIDIGSSIAGGVLIVLGTLVSLLQRLLLLQSFERPLTKAERDILRRVFLNSVSLYNVRIVEGWCGVFGFNNRAFCLGNVIYMKDNDPSVVPEILVHECVHVWQYQNIGTRYSSDALGAQALFPEDAYDWEADIARGNTEWTEFNKESAASFVQDVWQGGSLVTGSGQVRTGSGSFYDLQGGTSDTVNFFFGGTDYTTLAVDGTEALRGRINPRWSRAF